MGQKTKVDRDELLSAGELREAKGEALSLGRDYGDWDEDQLSQSAEMANNISPELRRLAGYEDSGTGTYTELPDVDGMKDSAIEDEISANVDDLFEAFWEGHAQRAEEIAAAARAKRIAHGKKGHRPDMPGGPGDKLPSLYLGEDGRWTPSREPEKLFGTTCSSCGKNEAIGTFTFDDEGKILYDRPLCESCAEDYGVLDDD